MESMELWITSAQGLLSQEKDTLLMEKLRESTENSIQEAIALLFPYTIPLFRKRFLRYMKLTRKAEFSSFFHSRNYEIVRNILKRMAREVRKAEEQKKEGREWLYRRLGHSYTPKDLDSYEVDNIICEVNIPLARGVHGWYYTYYVRVNEKYPLQVFPRFINLYRQEIKAKLRQIKRDYYDDAGREYQEGLSGHKEALSKRTRIYKIEDGEGGKTKYYSILAAAKKCKMRPKTLYNWVAAGKIPFSLITQDGIGKLKLINPTGLRCIQLEKKKRTNRRAWLRKIMQERGYNNEAAARQVICRLRKRVGLPRS